MKKNKKFEPVKVEIFNTRKGRKQYYTARNPDGTIDQRLPVAGSKTSLAEMKSLYKKQYSFDENKVRNPLTNVTQVAISTPVKAKSIAPKSKAEVKAMTKKERKEYKQAILPARDRKPLSKVGQRGKASYFVEGYYQGQKYVGTSKFKGSTAPDGFVFPESATSKACKESAWASLLKQISKRVGAYDEDEGITMIENNGLQRVREGWIFFTSGSSKFHKANK